MNAIIYKTLKEGDGRFCATNRETRPTHYAVKLQDQNKPAAFFKTIKAARAYIAGVRDSISICEGL